FRGCLLAALAGDCLGAQFEFLSSAVQLPHCLAGVRRQHARAAPLAAGVHRRHGADKGRLRVARRLPAVALNRRRWPRSLTTPTLRPPTVATARPLAASLKTFENANFADPFGPAAALFEGRAMATGGAMRAAPLGLIGAAAAAAPNAEEVHLATRVTHSNALALAGARLMAAAVRLALRFDGVDVDRLYDSLAAEAAAADTACGLHEGEASSYTSSMRQVKEFLGKHPASSAVDEEARANPSIDEALSIEQRQQQQQRLLDCLTFAVSLGGDTDTIASMAGAIVGAALGADALPASLMLACEASDAVDSLATRLH
uniref:ADP-ribosylhydrolase ARH3 n=1 Tax=Macrostomum lignano TaxID=282301 RepID=A0A1I8FBP4_9PLAT